MDDSTVFDDIMAGLHEIEEHQKGNIKLRSRVVAAPDEMADKEQLLWHKIESLPKSDKQKVIQFVDEILINSGA
ncbi:MAG: hypothetical protein FWB71_02745 [Defluviitaleaceae bacterium]|nr:hypothetical protein [Defluviitaleaceae bacterium]